MNDIAYNKYVLPLFHKLRRKGLLVTEADIVKLFEKVPENSEYYWFNKGANAIADLINLVDFED